MGSVDNTYSLRIGRAYLASSGYHKGTTDEVRLYNRALTLEEIQGLAGQGTVHYVNRYYEKDVSAGVATTYYYQGSRLVALRKGSALEYVHQDHLGGTIATTNTSGAIAATQEYYAFGELRS
ncbi:MAG: hypothetical protein HY533_05085, partial [Chloroflexi bacterium]|nr:hypothetical protein [Chloroflexota bacterium]